MKNKSSQHIQNEISQLTHRLQELSIEQKEIAREIDRLNNIDISIESIPTSTRTFTPSKPTDKNGTALEVGQTVRLLTIGKFISNTGKITKIGKAKVTIKLNKTGRSTTRNFNNVLVQ
jgi:transcription antitermination factor NusG